MNITIYCEPVPIGNGEFGGFLSFFPDPAVASKPPKGQPESFAWDIVIPDGCIIDESGLTLMMPDTGRSHTANDIASFASLNLHGFRIAEGYEKLGKIGGRG